MALSIFISFYIFFIATIVQGSIFWTRISPFTIRGHEVLGVNSSITFASEKPSFLTIKLLKIELDFEVVEKYNFAVPKVEDTKCRRAEKACDGEIDDGLVHFRMLDACISCCSARISSNGNGFIAYKISRSRPLIVATFLINSSKEERVFQVTDGSLQSLHFVNDESIEIFLDIAPLSANYGLTYLNQWVLRRDELFYMYEHDDVNSLNEWDTTKLGWLKRAINGSLLMPHANLLSHLFRHVGNNFCQENEIIPFSFDAAVSPKNLEDHEMKGPFKPSTLHNSILSVEDVDLKLKVGLVLHSHDEGNWRLFQPVDNYHNFEIVSAVMLFGTAPMALLRVNVSSCLNSEGRLRFYGNFSQIVPANSNGLPVEHFSLLQVKTKSISETCHLMLETRVSNRFATGWKKDAPFVLCIKLWTLSNNSFVSCITRVKVIEEAKLSQEIPSAPVLEAFNATFILSTRYSLEILRSFKRAWRKFWNWPPNLLMVGKLLIAVTIIFICVRLFSCCFCRPK